MHCVFLSREILLNDLKVSDDTGLMCLIPWSPYENLQVSLKEHKHNAELVPVWNYKNDKSKDDQPLNFVF